MGFWSFFFIIVFLGLTTQWYGTNKALKLNSNIKEGPKLPSLPSYYGANAFLWLVISVLLFLIVWVFSKPHILDYILIQNIPKALIDEFGGTPNMLIDIIKATDISNIFPGTPF